VKAKGVLVLLNEEVARTLSH